MYSFLGLLSPITTNLVACNNKNVFFHGLGDRRAYSPCTRGAAAFPREALRENLSPAPVEASAAGQHSVASSSTSLCLSPCLSSSRKDTALVGIRGLPHVV